MSAKKQTVQPRVAPKPRPAGIDLPVPAVSTSRRDGLDDFFAPPEATTADGVPTVAPKARRRGRAWEHEHGYGKTYSVFGVRSDVRKWVADTAGRLDVRTGEVAESAIRYAVELLLSGRLKIVPYLNPRGRRHTLYPEDPSRRARREKKVIITWWPFDQDLKKWIAEAGEVNDIAQGELVTFLLEKARERYERGDLKFNFQKESIGRAEFRLP